MGPKRSKSGSGGQSKRKGRKSRSPTTPQEKGYPDDIFPLVLTSVTQEHFDCILDEDVTKEHPFKLLNKDDIVQDMKTRAAVSDFSPAKQLILDYPEDEMLLVYDVDFTYGQSFYLVVTPEAKARIMKTPEPENVEEAEEEIPKTPEPKPWVPLGSDKDIEEEFVKEIRVKLKFVYLRERRKFGTPVSFSDRNSFDAESGCVDCPSVPSSKVKFTKMESDRCIQAWPNLKTRSIQTEWKTQINIFTQYIPRELPLHELKLVVMSKGFRKFCSSVAPRLIYALQQEEIMNVFIDDWKAMATGEDESDWSEQAATGLMLYQAFTDQLYTKDKKISCIKWHPNIHGVIAVALMKKKEEQSEATSALAARPSFIIFFSFSDPFNPQLLLECPDDILVFDFCPTHPNIIFGGCMNGQVVLWDITPHRKHLQENQPSKGSSANADTFIADDKEKNKIPVMYFSAVSAVESSHKSPITDGTWLPPTFQVTSTAVPVENVMKISAQIVTCSPDRTVMFWDVRLPKQLSQSLSDKSKSADQMHLIKTNTVPDTFKHLEQIWKPLYRFTIPKIEAKGEFVPLKLSVHHSPRDFPDKGTELELTESLPNYSHLPLPTTSAFDAIEGLNTTLLVGSEDGEIIFTDWNVNTDMSSGVYHAKADGCFNAHHYFVNTMQRSPFFKDIILTIGGRTFAIWQEGVMNGPLVLSYSEEGYASGCWSLTRPAVFFMGKGDGRIEVWNLMENTYQPSHLNPHFTNAHITSISPWSSPKQHFLAVGDDAGVLRVFKIPKALFIPSKDEMSSMKRYFDQDKMSVEDYLKRMEAYEEQRQIDEENEKEKKKVVERPTKLAIDLREVELSQYHTDTMVVDELGLLTPDEP